MADWRSDDRELLARILTAEAGNQGPVGMLAAGNVIMNRANTSGYGDGVRGVIMKPGQFSPMNSVTGYAGGEQGQNIDALTPSETAYMVADSLLAGTAGDITGGATHFYNPDISQPSWAEGRDFTRIGDHVFGRADAGRVATPTARVNTMNQPTPPMQQEEQPRGLRGLLSDPDFFDRLAIGLGGLTMNPNTALMQMAADRISGRQEERQGAETRNRTAEWLRSRGRDDLADAVMSGALGGREAATIAYQPEAQPRAPIQVDGRLVDPETFEVLYESPAAAPDQTAIRGARTEFTGLPAVRSFAEQTSAYGRVVASAEDPSPSGDLALIFNFMKVLDPGSVVREGEFATAQNAGGIDERTRSLYNRLMSGERLTQVQREDFLDRSTRLYRQAEEQYKDISNQYSEFARAAGLPVEQIIPDFSFTGEIPNTEVPPTPTGYSRQDWMDLWRSMTPAQRTAFMEAGQ